MVTGTVSIHTYVAGSRGRAAVAPANDWLAANADAAVSDADPAARAAAADADAVTTADGDPATTATADGDPRGAGRVAADGDPATLRAAGAARHVDADAGQVHRDLQLASHAAKCCLGGEAAEEHGSKNGADHDAASKPV